MGLFFNPKAFINKPLKASLNRHFEGLFFLEVNMDCSICKVVLEYDDEVDVEMCRSCQEELDKLELEDNKHPDDRG